MNAGQTSTTKRKSRVALIVFAWLLIVFVLANVLRIVPNRETVLWFAVALPVYLIPTYIAHRRAHHQFPAILALNLLLGWTFFGWAVALVWALTKTTKLSA